MSISLILEMASSVNPGRVAVVDGDFRFTTGELADAVEHAAGYIIATGARHVAYVGTGGVMQPLLILASARAAVPYTPLNYRLAAEAIKDLISRLPEPLVIVDSRYQEMFENHLGHVVDTETFLAAIPASSPAARHADPDDVAIVLFTSGTTSTPKAVELTHNNLTSYITGTVEFGSAATADAALICVPPYHIAGVNAALSNLYAGRKMVYLETFDADKWIRLAAHERVTTATVVPTMLDRIIAQLELQQTDLPALCNLAYGGSKVPLPLIRKALQLLPHVGFVNAYGLTETSSTIAVLSPEDHWEAHLATEESVARRLGSVGRPVPDIEVQIRGEDGVPLPSGQAGELYVRGEQVSGHYTGIGSVLDADGWFPTRDLATLDSEGYLFIIGRADDTIIRGGENVAPAEIEDVLVEHPDVRQVAVVGVEDTRWGQALVAVIVPRQGCDPDPGELRNFVRSRLRGSRTPDQIVFRAELPVTPTGKVVRRDIVADLSNSPVPLST